MKKLLEIRLDNPYGSMSQIHPHFLYNTLNGIMELCDTDPQKASKAVQHHIVKNAVWYGLTTKKNGGTLCIKSEKTIDSVIFTVLDDGNGFNESRVIDDGRSYVGPDNVQKRLETLCRGKPVIQTEKGVGTEVTIILPSGGIGNENNGG